MSLASAIEDWLRNVVLTSPPDRCPPRRCPSPPIAERPAKRRRPLQSLDANVMPPRTFPSSPTKTPGDVDETPRQVRRYALRSASGTGPDDRPPPVFSLERFNPPDAPPLYASAQALPSPTRTSSSASTGRSSNKRSTSPVKGPADLMYNNTFNYKSMYDAEDGELGADIDDLCARLRGMQQCDGVVPESARVLVDTLPRRVRDDFYDRNYAKTQDDRPRDRVIQEFLEINELMQTSTRYSGLAYSEAAWNDAVHSKVLQVALRGVDGVEWQNITQASISPRNLIALHHLHLLGNKLEGKMVDYALSITPTQALTDRITSLLQLEASSQSAPPTLHQSINHTTYAPLRLSPISVSIETKTPDGNQSEAKGQLAVWSAAHLARLDRLRRAVQTLRSSSNQDEAVQASSGSVTTTTLATAPLPPIPALPTLPLILAAGASWHLYFIKMDDAGKVTMFDYRPLGDTASLLGIYKLLCGIRALAGWTCERLRPWYDELAVAGGL